MEDRLAHSMAELAQLLDAPRQSGTALGNWRWTVRQRLAAVRDDLAHESGFATNGWLMAREGHVLRERNSLLHRMATLSPFVLETPDPDDVRHDLRRLLADVTHHRQRIHDLVYDEVEIELGGSE
ncbi:hypothetical protein NODU109028_01670 [Nocardioides dubius]|uniref:DUF4254 domain-containing protein n=1 Tax=Nocardioides dubius TaxID=317019 RepID=A0ABP4EF45_9ACTN